MPDIPTARCRSKSFSISRAGNAVLCAVKLIAARKKPGSACRFADSEMDLFIDDDAPSTIYSSAFRPARDPGDQAGGRIKGSCQFTKQCWINSFILEQRPHSAYCACVAIAIAQGGLDKFPRIHALCHKLTTDPLITPG